MRTEVREEVRKYTTYITEDGQEFTNRHQALVHEGELIKARDPRNIPEDYIELFNDDHYGARIYYFKTEDDLHYVGQTEWIHYTFYDKFKPGWYMAVYNDGGDGYDYYDVSNFDDYRKQMRECLTMYDQIIDEWRDKV